MVFGFGTLALYGSAAASAFLGVRSILAQATAEADVSGLFGTNGSILIGAGTIATAIGVVGQSLIRLYREKVAVDNESERKKRADAERERDEYRTRLGKAEAKIEVMETTILQLHGELQDTGLVVVKLSRDVHLESKVEDLSGPTATTAVTTAQGEAMGDATVPDARG